jgi:hypothetical protein
VDSKEDQAITASTEWTAKKTGNNCINRVDSKEDRAITASTEWTAKKTGQ